jgi:MSHA pilin protein MshA
MLKRKLMNQKGFTLIEIIAVLVILGILAAVAVPRYIDMQTEARIKAVQGAISALQSTASMNYARALLANPPTATANTCSTCDGAAVVVGDYTGSIAHTDGAGGVFTVIVTGPANLITDVAAADRTKTFSLWE